MAARAVLFSPLLCGLLLAACAPSGRTIPDAERTDHARLVFTGTGHDFGRQERHQTLSHTVTFANGGRAPLTIEKIDTNCGCAAALLSRRTIPPGGRGTIRITWQTGGVAGRSRKTMEIATNDPETPVSRYPMSIDVIGDAYLDPTVVAVRGTRAEGAVEAHFDVIALDAGENLKITEVTASHAGISTRVTPLPADDRRKGYRVHLRFGPELGTGRFRERVIVRTNSSRDPALPIDVIGSVARQVLAVPERLYFPRVEGTVSRSVVLSRRDGRPLDVLRVEDPTGLLTVGTERRSPTRWEIHLRLAGENPAHGVRSVLLVHTDAEDDATITIPLSLAGAAE